MKCAFFFYMSKFLKIITSFSDKGVFELMKGADLVGNPPFKTKEVPANLPRPCFLNLLNEPEVRTADDLRALCEFGIRLLENCKPRVFGLSEPSLIFTDAAYKKGVASYVVLVDSFTLSHLRWCWRDELSVDQSLTWLERVPSASNVADAPSIRWRSSCVMRLLKGLSRALLAPPRRTRCFFRPVSKLSRPLRSRLSNTMKLFSIFGNSGSKPDTQRFRPNARGACSLRGEPPSAIT